MASFLISGFKITVFLPVNTQLQRKKKDREFPVPSRDVTTKLSLGEIMTS